jgi:hypothetical protein
MRLVNDVRKLAALFVILTIASVDGRLCGQDAVERTAQGKDTTGPPEQPPPHDSAESYVKIRVEVELRGRLHYAAAGSTITAIWRNYELYHDDKVLPGAASEPWKLDFSRAKQLQATAKSLDGKEVVITGKSELRMEVRLLPPGGSGFGGRDWPPAPTWSVQRTVLVSGVRLPD